MKLFEEMQAGKHPEGSLLLRAKIDMNHPNMNMRDPPMHLDFTKCFCGRSDFPTSWAQGTGFGSVATTGQVIVGRPVSVSLFPSFGMLQLLEVYPIYDFAHGNEDAIEGVTHSICTLEFENHRALYDWFLDACLKCRTLTLLLASTCSSACDCSGQYFHYP